jgi:ribosomal protein L11
MAGASIAQDIANSPKTAATLDKVYKIVDKKLDEQLSEGIDEATKKIEETAK